MPQSARHRPVSQDGKGVSERRAPVARRAGGLEGGGSGEGGEGDERGEGRAHPVGSDYSPLPIVATALALDCTGTGSGSSSSSSSCFSSILSRIAVRCLSAVKLLESACFAPTAFASRR